MSDSSPVIKCFCDGGLGNRINSIITADLVARTFGVELEIVWPVNSWCGAAFEEIFDSTGWLVTEDSLADALKKGSYSSVFLQHKEDAELAGVNYCHISSISELGDFEELFRSASSLGQDLLFYTGVLPVWVSPEAIASTLINLRFRAELVEIATSIVDKIARPYYGIHLRRTDNPIGYCDREIFDILTMTDENFFFIATECEKTFKKFSHFPNVFTSRPRNFVSRRIEHYDFNSLETSDEIGRKLRGNVLRSGESVRQAVIDLLLLSGSNYLGPFRTGSTFANLGEALRPIYRIGEKFPRLDRLDYIAIADVLRFSSAAPLPTDASNVVLDSLMRHKRLAEALMLIKMGRLYDRNEPLALEKHSQVMELIRTGLRK